MIFLCENLCHVKIVEAVQEAVLTKWTFNDHDRGHL